MQCLLVEFYQISYGDDFQCLEDVFESGRDAEVFVHRGVQQFVRKVGFFMRAFPRTFISVCMDVVSYFVHDFFQFFSYSFAEFMILEDFLSLDEKVFYSYDLVLPEFFG